jgi:hypothetical protein
VGKPRPPSARWLVCGSGNSRYPALLGRTTVDRARLNPHPPAGWYPDPTAEVGKERYWSGSAWTQERRTVLEEPEASESSVTASEQLHGYFRGQGRPPQRPAQTTAAQPTTSQHSSFQAPGTTRGERLGKAWAQAGAAVECPGCHTTTGPPGALCPACGSRFPSPRVAMVGIAVALLGGFFLFLEGVGWLCALVGGGMVVYSVGRSGPQRQSSCCGCSCAIALLAIPAAGWAVWTAGGPLLAAAAVPAWIPLSWALEAESRLWRLVGLGPGTALLKQGSATTDDPVA